MKPGLKQDFIQRWGKYFPGVDLPIAFYYTDDAAKAPVHRITEGQHCFVNDLVNIRQGKSLSFDTKSIACFGGKRYLGFSTNLTKVAPQTSVISTSRTCALSDRDTRLG